MQRVIFLRGRDVPCPAVVIDKHGHVPRHLPAGVVALQETDLRILGGVRIETHRPRPAVGPVGAVKPIGSGDLLRDRHGRPGGGVAFAAVFEVEPHHETLGPRVVNHLRPLDDAALGNLAARVLLDGQRDAFVLPSIKIGGGITGNANLRRVSQLPGHLVLAEPMVFPFMPQHPAAMGVDGLAAIVRPDFTGRETVGRTDDIRGKQGDDDPSEHGMIYHPAILILARSVSPKSGETNRT